jgi:branched-subunit amino acid transport protein
VREDALVTEAPAFWWLIFWIALGTFLLRLSFVLVIGHLTMPPAAQRLLRLVPAAVLSALIFPALLFRNGELALGAGNERLLAGGLAALVAVRTKSVVLTIVVGMIALWILSAVSG